MLLSFICRVFVLCALVPQVLVQSESNVGCCCVDVMTPSQHRQHLSFPPAGSGAKRTCIRVRSWEAPPTSTEPTGQERRAYWPPHGGGGVPEDLFLSNEERRWQLLTSCSLRTQDEVRRSISTIFLLSGSIVAPGYRAPCHRLSRLFIIKQYAFNRSDLRTEAFLSKFKTLCVCSVLDI